MSEKNFRESILRLDENLAQKFRVVTEHYGGDKTGALRALIIAEFRRIVEETSATELGGASLAADRVRRKSSLRKWKTRVEGKPLPREKASGDV